MRRFLFFFIVTLITSTSLFAGKEIEISREFTLLTSQHAQGYLKPLFTTIGESFNSGLYTKADYRPVWSVAIDFTASGMFIPNSQKTYNAELPDLYGQNQYVLTARKTNGKVIENVGGTLSQPTLYGGSSQAVFAAPQNHFAPDSFYKSVAFIEGNNISLMSGIPSLQLVLGLPTRTQIRGRFFAVPMQDESLTYFTIAVNQNIDKLFNLFEDTTSSLAAHFAYHSFNRKPGIEMSSLALGVHFSKEFSKGFYGTLGMQYENLNGKFKAVKEVKNGDDIINSPYTEIRNAMPFNFDIESFTNFRIGGGLSYKIGFLELNGSAYYASQPVIALGATFWLFEQKEKATAPPPPPPPAPEPEPAPVPAPIVVHDMKVDEAPQFEAPAVVLTEPEKKKLSADVMAYSVENGVEKPLLTIKMEENISKHVSPLLPMVFFDDNSAEIPDRYIKISKDSAKKFVGTEVSDGTALDVYYEIMNVIGRRMNTWKDANLTLTGTNSGIGKEKNNKKLSAERAEKVRNYLIDVWSIDPKRIKVISRNLPVQASNSKDPDGVEENRRVEIASDTWEIIAPSVIQDTARLILPPLIRFKQTANAEAGLNDWKLIVSSNSRKIKEEHGKTTITPSIDWQVQDDELIKGMIRNNLQFNLSVSDNEGKNFLTDVHTLPVELKTIKKENAKSGDTITNIYDLILFDFNKSTLSGDNLKIINMIKSEMPNDAMVKVTGYTDRMGNDEYNRKLSQGRAVSAAKALGRPDAQTIGSGESVLLYDNNRPEGRFYSRTVIVEVKIPVK